MPLNRTRAILRLTRQIHVAVRHSLRQKKIRKFLASCTSLANPGESTCWTWLDESRRRHHGSLTRERHVAVSQDDELAISWRELMQVTA